jgi:hypothetical protein
LRSFDKEKLKKIFGPKREKWPEDGENCEMRSFMVF